MRYKLTYQGFNNKGNLKGHQVVISAEEVRSMFKTLMKDEKDQINTTGFEYGLERIDK